MRWATAGGRSSRPGPSRWRATRSPPAWPRASDASWPEQPPRTGLSSIAVATTATDSNLTAQRRALPDAPGVYLFKDRKGKVLYVGKARSIRKRVGSHFSKPGTRGAVDMIDQIDQIDFVATQTEAEALLTEQRFIRQHRPVFNIRLRDDKS